MMLLKDMDFNEVCLVPPESWTDKITTKQGECVRVHIKYGDDQQPVQLQIGPQHNLVVKDGELCVDISHANVEVLTTLWNRCATIEWEHRTEWFHNERLPLAFFNQLLLPPFQKVLDKQEIDYNMILNVPEGMVVPEEVESLVITINSVDIGHYKQTFNMTIDSFVHNQRECVLKKREMELLIREAALKEKEEKLQACWETLQTTMR